MSTVRLVAAPAPVPGPAPDPAQARVVATRAGEGPLVVLGAPGTGKTSTLLDLVVARVERDGVPAHAVLVLAASRAAAASLRDGLSARLRRTVTEPLARTPHSYAFGLLRKVRVLDGDVPPRLISGPEQDRILAELLAGHLDGAGRSPGWPGELSPEIRSLRGFRGELRELLMRALERGMSPEDLADLGRRADRPEWAASGALLAEYLDVTSLATPGAYDPAGIVDAAAWLLQDDEQLRAQEWQDHRLVVVDDAQELSAAAVRLLDVLCGSGRDLVLAGDPDVATQGFRGASPQLLAEAPTRFPTVSGEPAPVHVLPQVWRHGPSLRAVARRVADRIGSTGTVVQRSAQAADRSGPVDGPMDGPVDGPVDAADAVTVQVVPSRAHEAALVAGALRRWHLAGGLPWDRMAVVVRSTRGASALRRALNAAGVPVTVPATELPVRDEPAVRPLRLALRCVLDPRSLTVETAVDLLTGPLGGADAVALRRLRQVLRAEELGAGGIRSSDDLLVEAVSDPARVAALPSADAAPARRVARILAAGRAAAGAAGRVTAETVLWAIWDAARLAEPWRRAALGGGVPGARADRDLDAVVALFDAAARYVDRMPTAGPAGFLEYLEAQDLPADSLARRAPADRSVALLSPVAAAGREWDAVIVAGVQEGAWPDVRLRDSLLGGELLADVVDGRGDPGADTALGRRRALLDDELRLFHVAVSRARRQLLVTAVSSEEELPSPFLALVDPSSAGSAAGSPMPASGSGSSASSPDPDPDDRSGGPGLGPLSLPALVAELRSVLGDPGADAADARAATQQLAELARAGVPGAHPDDWYGIAGTTGTGRLRSEHDPVTVTPSTVESFARCALKWLLEQSGGRGPSSASQSIGTLVHRIAESAPDGDPDRLRGLLDEWWHTLALREGWPSARERARTERMIEKLAEYLRTSGRELVAVEQRVHVPVGEAVLSGTVDRLERAPDGSLVVVDFKTTKNPPAAAEVAEHAQLGVYQAAVEAGGFDDVAGITPGGARSGGAVLVQLGATTQGLKTQQQPALAGAEDPGWAHALIGAVVEGMRGEGFAATGNDMCRMCPVIRSCPLHPQGRQVGS